MQGGAGAWSCGFSTSDVHEFIHQALSFARKQARKQGCSFLESLTALCSKNRYIKCTVLYVVRVSYCAHSTEAMEGGREEEASMLLDKSSPSCPSHLAGGKGHNLWVLGSMEGCQVPDWFCITTNAFSAFIEVLYHMPIPLTASEISFTKNRWSIFLLPMYKLECLF